MPQFAYIAIDASRNAVNGKTEQADRASVIAALTKQNLRPVSIKEVKKSAFFNIDFKNLFKQTRVKSDHLVIFTRQLSAMVGAGVPLLRSLTSLEKHAEDPLLKTILSDVIKNVEAGSSLADALKKHPDTFNDIYVNMVRAGETAGILDDILKRLAFQQEKSSAIRKKIRSAMAYPMVLLTITTLAFFGLMLFVIPQIGKSIRKAIYIGYRGDIELGAHIPAKQVVELFLFGRELICEVECLIFGFRERGFHLETI